MGPRDRVTQCRGPESWEQLREGDLLTVVKLAPNGDEAASYPGEVVASGVHGDWVVIRAEWTRRGMDVGGLVFRRGDLLLEWFSPTLWFNAFAVCEPLGSLKGWYANVTHPAWLDPGQQPPLLVWHDLYLDLVAGADGAISVRDADELAASGIAASDPALHRRIVAAGAELTYRYERGQAPFAARAELARLLAR